MKLKSNGAFVSFVMAAGKDFVQSQMKVENANEIIKNGEVAESNKFPGYPICVNDTYYFEGTFSKRKKSTSSEVEPNDVAANE